MTEAYAAFEAIKSADDKIHRLTAKERAASAILRRLAEGSLIARATSFNYWHGLDQKRLDPKTRAVPRCFWGSFSSYRLNAVEDWTAGDFSFASDPMDFVNDVSGLAHSVELDRNGLPAISQRKGAAGNDGSARQGSGAPRKWDWDGALVYLAAVAHFDPNGLFRKDGREPNQSDIARHLADWFIGTKGEAPESSQLRAYGKRFQAELNALKVIAANNLKAAS